ncbi:MAG: penicillin acylase family protein [Acidimicrobiia bacterium]
MKLTSYLVGGLCAALVALPAAGASNNQATGSGSQGRYQEFGDAGGFMNIFAPGQNATMTAAQLQANLADPTQGPAHAFDQIKLYDALAHTDPATLTDAPLSSYFKDASFGVADSDIERSYHPANNADVTVIRDKTAGVPHIFGTTRYATMFAQGYTAAEDRLLIMDVLRRVGRGTLSELVGKSLGEQNDRSTIASSPYQPDEFTEQVDAFAKQGPEGQAIKADMDSYADGVNAYIKEAATDPTKLPAEYSLLGSTPAPWSSADSVAIAANIGGIFGKGGGGELNLACALGSPGTSAMRATLNDVIFPNDPEAPVTTTRSAPYGPKGPLDPAANPTIDCASLKEITPNGSSATGGLGGGDWVQQLLGGLTLDDHMSNAILISGDHTKSGKPIAVFGPQVGYSAPGLLIEKDVHGPGIDARGASFVGTDFYVELGRGSDYAWSATSSGADNIDQVILELCDPTGVAATVDSMGYKVGSACKPIEAFDHTETLKGDDPANPSVRWQVQRSPEYGPITHRGTLVDGRPIAVATRRSTYGNELRSAVGFKRLNDPAYMKNGYESFRTAVGEGIDFTFNWFYIDDTTIGYQHSCKCPIRSNGVDTALPVLANGAHDWNGYASYKDQPWDSNPKQGYLASWNNRPAPDFQPAETEQWGSVQRVQALTSRAETAIASGKKLERADVVGIMADAATVDTTGANALPWLLKVLGTEAPAGMDPRVLDARERLEIWADAGAHRRALTDPKVYDDAVGPAIMDAWWDTLRTTAYNPVLGDLYKNGHIDTSDTPRAHGGSSFLSPSFMSLVNKDLRSVLGEHVEGPLSKGYCGEGDLTACRAALWDSLAATMKVLESPKPTTPADDSAKVEATNHFGTPEVASWQRSVADDEIQFQGLLSKAVPMAWQNRPTFQQVVELERSGRSSKAERAPSTPKTSPSSAPTSSKSKDGSTPTWQLAVAALAAVAVIGATLRSLRRRRKQTPTPS